MGIIRTTHAFSRRRAIQRPGWVLPYANVDFDFVNNRQFGGQWLGGKLVTVRSSTADYVDDVQGRFWSVGASVPRISNRGLLVEGAATNVVIRNRDLTQAAWVKVNMTAALDQIGIDGAASSASSITATAGNATILQTDVLGSSSRRASAYVKRITGSGTINMTGDGSTYTAVTVTSNWTRVNLAAATVVNPVTGFQIVTSGDAIAVDFVQNETGPVVTSPILTGAASVTRSADNITFSPFPAFWMLPTVSSMYAEFVVNQVNIGGSQTVLCFDDGTTNNRLFLRESSGAGTFAVTDATVSQAGINPGTAVAGGISKLAASWEPNLFNAALGGVLGTQDLSGTVPWAAITTLRIGATGSAGTQALNGYLRRIAFSRQRWTQSNLIDITVA